MTDQFLEKSSTHAKLFKGLKTTAIDKTVQEIRKS